MTNKEVINFLNQVRKILLDDKSWLESTTQPINEAFDMAISALEKQIRKKPNYKEEDRFVKELFAVYTYCPVCEKEVGVDDMYCVCCGQAIDWTGVE